MTELIQQEEAECPPFKRKIFFTSDPHYGHTNVIKYSNRPFANADEMDEEMIKRWNAKVRPGDIVFIIGDFAFHKPGRAQAILNRLNGEKHLVFGNHDSRDLKSLHGWASVSPYKEIKVDEDCYQGKIVLCHYAMRVWNKSHHGSLMLHGHSHGSLPTINNQSTDVGVDCWNYAPVELSELVEFLKKFPPMKALDHHGA